MTLEQARAWADYLDWVHRAHGGWVGDERRYADGTTPAQAHKEWELRKRSEQQNSTLEEN